MNRKLDGFGVGMCIFPGTSEFQRRRWPKSEAKASVFSVFRTSIADFVLRFFELSVANHAVLRLPIVAGDSPESLVVILGSKRRRRGWLEDLQAAARVVADWFA